MDEVPLSGGNVSTVVRVGDTVRRPTGAWTPAVHALLRHLEAEGFAGAPRVLGIDERGREMLSFIEGDMAGPDLDATVAARLLRDFHDAVATFVAPPDAVWRDLHVPRPDGPGMIVCHNDPGSWNIVVRPDRSMALIDWDYAGPAPAMWDIAYLVRALVPVERTTVRAVADAYELTASQRQALPEWVERRAEWGVEWLRVGHERGIQPWSRLWDEGHGASWRAALDWVRLHRTELTP